MVSVRLDEVRRPQGARRTAAAALAIGGVLGAMLVPLVLLRRRDGRGPDTAGLLPTLAGESAANMYPSGLEYDARQRPPRRG